jgi:uncharacterized protein (DUF362 family)
MDQRKLGADQARRRFLEAPPLQTHSVGEFERTSRATFDRIDNESLQKKLRASLDYLQWTSKIRTDSTVFVKPNLTWPRYRPGVVTSPRFLSTLLPMLKNRAARVLVGESDLPIFETSRAFRQMGIDKICKDAGSEPIELSKSPTRRVRAKVSGKEVSLNLSRLLLDDTDVVVNVPVPKCHVVTKMSCALKNFYGLIPNPFRGNEYRHDINRAIVAVNTIVRSDFVLVDGSYSLAGRGPIMGEPVRTNILVASNNAVAADSIVAQFFEMDPKSVSHLRLASETGLGEYDLKKVIMERPISYTIRLRPRRKPMDNLAVMTFKSRILNYVIMNSPITPLLYQLIKPFRAGPEMDRYQADIGGLPQSQFGRKP